MLKREFVLLTLGVVVGALLGFAMLSARSVVALDYRAFYCAGMAVRHHANPYHTDALHNCELNATDDLYRERLPTTTLPAPQPLYDIAVFAVLSNLPFALSKAIWGAILGISIFITAASLVRLTGLSPPVIFAVLGISLMADSLALGQIIPVYTAGACAAALLAKEERFAWAGVAATFSLIEPHLGAPIWVALALFAPRSRPTLFVGAATLAFLAFVAGGVSTNIEYFRTVLPLHALSELGSDGQLSLSVILHALGVPDARAVQLGTLSYICMCALGVWAGRLASLRFGNAAFVVAVPAAAAVIGGSFLHTTDLVAAIPLALLLVGFSQLRTAAALALVLLATPWSPASHPMEIVGWFLISGAVAGYILRRCGGLQRRLSLVSAIAIFAILFGLNVWYARTQQLYQERVHPAIAIDPRYPEAGWAQIVHESLSTASVAAWAIRIPSWGGVTLLVVITSAAIRQVRPRLARA